MNVHKLTSLGQRLILSYKALYVPRNCTHFTYSLKTNSYVSCREYCKQFEINTAIHLLPDTLNIDSNKHNLTYILRLYFYLSYLGGSLIYFVSCQTNRRGQTSPKVPLACIPPLMWETMFHNHIQYVTILFVQSGFLNLNAN